MRRRCRGACDARCPPIEIDTSADEVNRCSMPEVRHREDLAVNLDAASSGEASIAELLEKRQQPPITRHRRGRVRLAYPAQRSLEGRPGDEQAIPRSRDGFGEFLSFAVI